MSERAGVLAAAGPGRLPESRAPRPSAGGESWAGWWRRYRASLVTYLPGTGLAVAASQSWFRSGTFLATGDVPPFLRRGLASELGWLWNHQLTGAGSSSYDATRALEVAILRLVDLLGGSPLQAQRFLYAFLFGLAAFGAAFFARSLTGRPLPAAVAGLVGAFNPYLLVNLPLPLPPLAVGLMGIAGGLVLRAGQGRRVRPGVVAMVSVLASYLALSPALLGLAVVWVLGCGAAASALCGPGSTRRALLLVARSAPWVLLLNLWWMVPLAWFALGEGGGLPIATDTAVADWAWSHTPNSLPNVLALSAHWGPVAGSAPYAALLDSPAWGGLRFLLPVAALSAPFVARRRRAALVLIAAASLLAALGQGLHPPFGALNRSLYQSLPGMWLLREPMSKVGAPLLLTYVGLLGLALEGVLDRAAAQHRRGRKLLVITVLWMTGIIVYPYPLWLGGLASAHAAVPNDWLEAADLVDASPQEGKVLVLPLSPSYQVPTRWGYYGVDLTALEVMRRPVIQLLPGGYFRQPPGFENLVREVERALVAGSTAQVPRLLQALGVSYVLVRHDLDPALSPRPFTDPAQLARTLGRVPGVHLAASLSVADVYEVTGSKGSPVRAYSSVVSARTQAPSRIVAHLAPTQALIESTEVQVSDFVWELGASTGTSLLRVATPGLYRLQVGAEPLLSWEETRSPETGGDGDTGSRPSVVVRMDGQAPMNDGLLRLGSAGRTVFLDRRSDTVARVEADFFSLPFASFEACGPPGNSWEGGGGVAGLPGGEIRFEAEAGTVCAWTALPEARVDRVYRVQFEHRTVSGLKPRVCLWQEGPDRCADLAPLPAGREWTAFEAAARLDPRTTGLRLYLYADGTELAHTAVEFRDIRVTAVPDLWLTAQRLPERAEPAPPVLRWTKEGPSRYVVQVQGAEEPYLLVLSEAYSPGWQISGTADPAGIPHLEIDGYANGWWVSQPGPTTLVLEYVPARMARLAIQLSAAAALGLAAMGAVQALVHRRARSTAG